MLESFSSQQQQNGSEQRWDSRGEIKIELARFFLYSTVLNQRASQLK